MDRARRDGCSRPLVAALVRCLAIAALVAPVACDRPKGVADPTRSERSLAEPPKSAVARRDCQTGRADPAPPRLAAELPHNAAGYALRRDTICFLRSHLVLNSAYFISQQNILGLDRTVEAVTTRYDSAPPDGKRRHLRLLLVRYPSAEAARAALVSFREGYLPETLSAPASAGSTVTHIEDGWAGYRAAGRGVAFVFEASDHEAAASLLAAGVRTLENVEAPHG